MAFWVEISLSAASFRAISQIASLAILQTIALPTELPRRDAHFTRKLVCQCTPKVSNGLEHYVRLAAQWSPDASTTTSAPLPNIRVAKHLHHCPCETIARACDC